MRTLVAIHQPNFFPWLGYFDKIHRADIFIFLDCVSYPRAGSGSMGSWTNRVKLAIQGQARWITCPVRRMPMGQPISAAQIDDRSPWRGKMLRSIEQNYARAPNFDRTMELITHLLSGSETNLARFNMLAIQKISVELGLSVRFMLQSELQHQGTGTDLLISLTKASGGTTYIAGGGTANYQKDPLFAMRGIELIYQNFKPVPYGDPKWFLPGLSAIDYLMRDGRPLDSVRL